MSTIELFAEQFHTSAVPQAVLDTSVGCVSLAVNRSHAEHFGSEGPVQTTAQVLQQILTPTTGQVLSCHCEEIQAVEALDLEQCVFLRMQRSAAATHTAVRDLEFRLVNQNGARDYQVYCTDARVIPEREGALAVALQPIPNHRIEIRTLGEHENTWRLRADFYQGSRNIATVPFCDLAPPQAPTYFEFVAKLQRARRLLRENNIADAFRELIKLEEAYRDNYPKRTLIVRLRSTEPSVLGPELERLWDRLFDYYVLTELVNRELTEKLLAQVPAPPAYRPTTEKDDLQQIRVPTTMAPQPMRTTAQQAYRLVKQEPYRTIIDTVTRQGSLSYADLETRLTAPGTRAAIDELICFGLLMFEWDAYLLTSYTLTLLSAGDTIISRRLDLDDLVASINSLHRDELIEIVSHLGVPAPVNCTKDRDLQQYLSKLAHKWDQDSDPLLKHLDELVKDIEVRELNQ